MKIQIKKPMKSTLGSALVATLIFSFITSVGISSLLKYQHRSFKVNHRSFGSNKALYLAEAGLHLALAELNHYDPPFSGAGPLSWSYSGGYETLSITDIGTVDVQVDYSDPDDVIIISQGLHQGVRRKLEIRTKKSTASMEELTFPGAIASGETMDLHNSFTSDSYSGGTYDPLNPGYNGHIFCHGSTIALKSGSIVRGHLYYDSGAICKTGETSNGEVYWTAADEAASNDRGGQLGSGSYQFIPAVVPPHLQMTGTPGTQISSHTTYSSGHYQGGASNLQNVTFSGGFYRIDGNIDIKAGSEWRILGDSDIYVTGDIDMGNNATIVNYTTLGGVINQVYRLRIFIDGDLTFSQGAQVNIASNITPSYLQIYGTGDLDSPPRNITIANASDFIGAVYAPNYHVELNNGGEVFGAFAVLEINPKNGSAIHFDERLFAFLNGTPPGKYGINGWRELQG